MEFSCRFRHSLRSFAVTLVASLALLAAPAAAAPDDATFVSATGSDSGTGTKANPFATIQKGIDVAKAKSNKAVYVSGGTFSSFTVPTDADGVAINGGNSPATWEPAAGETTTVNGSPQAALLSGATGIRLSGLTLRGAPDGGRSAYGVRAINGSSLLLDHVTSTANDAAAGLTGTTGSTGAAGLRGNDAPGGCAQGLTRSGGPGGNGGQGGSGGNNAGGANGSSGGGFLSAIGGTGGGLIGTVFGAGGSGGPGAPGSSAANNGFAALDNAAWLASFASSGNAGTPGAGGGGGRGGTGDNNFGVGICGGGGGGGGTGSGGGGGGTGGQNGGGSFGAYLLNSSVVAVASTLTGAKGGDGGSGGSGGFGGIAGGPGFGAPGDCLTVFVEVCGGAGANGGSGGQGGRGGGGGAGSGGPSYGVYQAGPTSGFAAREGTVTGSGAAGQGGFQGNAGPRAANGESVAWKRSATAPATSSADFDGDGMTDSADNCPGTPGTVSGCPEQPTDPGGTTGGGGGSAQDLVKPTWVLSVAKSQRALKTKAVKFAVKPSESCVLTVTAKLGKVKLGTAKKTLAGGTKSGVTIKLGKKALAALKKALRAKKSVKATLSFKAVDGAGNAAGSKRTVVLKR
jgi:hypothetical protein